MTSIDEIRQNRIEKVKNIQKKGINAFPVKTNINITNKDFNNNFENLLNTKEKCIIGGRIISIRGQGKVCFVDVFDGTDKKVQVFISSESFSKYDLFKEIIDNSDFIEFEGEAYITQRGAKAFIAFDFRLLSKSLRPVPDSWFGIQDEDERYRKRYLDMIIDEKLRSRIIRRSQFWNCIRQFLLKKDFIEVETPMLEVKTGGADARPFITHHNDFDMDVYMRISVGELWQKRLLIGGMPKTFEIGRVFRNEGSSPEHMQDYTALEYYEAYSDFEKGKIMVQDMYKHIANQVYKKTKFIQKGHEFDLESEWKEIDFCEIIKEHYDIDPLNTDIDSIRKKLIENDIEFDNKNLSLERGVDILWKKIRKNIAGPAFLVGVPVYLETLAKKSEKDNRKVERFQVILAGSEIGKGFSELNDPIDQAERFTVQQDLRDNGDDEAQMSDEDFVEAMEYGMPPAFGFGTSERLFSFLEGETTRESQIFPLMKPKY